MVSIAQILHSVDFRKVGMSKYCRKQPKKVKLYLTSLLSDHLTADLTVAGTGDFRKDGPLCGKWCVESKN